MASIASSIAPQGINCLSNRSACTSIYGQSQTWDRTQLCNNRRPGPNIRIFDAILFGSSNGRLSHSRCEAPYRDYSFIHTYSILNGVHAGMVSVIMHNPHHSRRSIPALDHACMESSPYDARFRFCIGSLTVWQDQYTLPTGWIVAWGCVQVIMASSKSFSVSGKTAIVTGAGSGLYSWIWGGKVELQN